MPKFYYLLAVCLVLAFCLCIALSPEVILDAESVGYYADSGEGVAVGKSVLVENAPSLGEKKNAFYLKTKLSLSEVKARLLLPSVEESPIGCVFYGDSPLFGRVQIVEKQDYLLVGFPAVLCGY